MKGRPGGTVIWVFAAVDLLTFTLFFGAYATSAAADLTIYAGSAALVHPRIAALNTGVLLTASWAAARAIGSSWRWWAGVAGLGLVAVRLRADGGWRGEPEEAAAISWHVVDLLWLGLFPLLYLLPAGAGR